MNIITAEHLTDALIASARADDESPGFPTLARELAAIGEAVNAALATIAAEYPDPDDAAALEAIATDFVFNFSPFEVTARDRGIIAAPSPNKVH